MAERARRSLHRFIIEGWSVLEPETPFRDNWHLGAICEHLEAVTAGQIRRLIINIPPGHMKSMGVAVFWPAWVWLQRPGWRSIFTSYAIELSVRDSIKCRNVIQSDWYAQSFHPDWQMDAKLNRADHFRNTKRGERQALSVGGATTGFRGDAIIADDPMNALEAYSEARRSRVKTWWSKAMSNRLNSLKTGARVIIAQRLHEDDLPGYLLDQGGWEHLMLPTEFETKRRCHTSIGFEDPRKEEGELLNPEMVGPDEVKEAKRDLGSDGFSANHQQSPTPAEGAMFKRAWFQKRWRRPGEEDLPLLETRVINPERHKWSSVIIVLDCTFKKTLDNDLVCMGVMAYDPPDRFILDLVWDRMSFLETVRAMADLCIRWPKARAKLIETKANGDAVVEVLRRKFSGIVEAQPLGGKEARAAAISPEVEGGNLWLPAYAPWVSGYIEEMVSFPKGKHDDAVDFTSYGLLRLSPSSSAERFRKLAKVR